MKKQTLKYLILGILILFNSCSPMTKESYLNDYKNFINKIMSESSNYSENDWKKADEQFNKYSKVWYNKFEDEFDWKDKVVLAKYEIQYNLYRYKENTKTIINNIFGNYSELKKEIKYYYDNGMENDIDFIIEQANELGGTYTKMLEDIFVELDIDLNVKLKANNRRND